MNQTEDSLPEDSLPPATRDALRQALVRAVKLMPLVAEDVAIVEAQGKTFAEVTVPPPPSIAPATSLPMAARGGEKLSATSQARLAELLREMKDNDSRP